MERNAESRLAEVYVHDMPNVAQTVSGGKVNPLWEQWANVFNTWLSQAQGVIEATDRLSVSRIGPLVTVTGTIGRGERIDGVWPYRSFSVGSVFFSEEGFIRNDGEETGISASFISKR